MPRCQADFRDVLRSIHFDCLSVFTWSIPSNLSKTKETRRYVGPLSANQSLKRILVSLNSLFVYLLSQGCSTLFYTYIHTTTPILNFCRSTRGKKRQSVVATYFDCKSTFEHQYHNRGRDLKQEKNQTLAFKGTNRVASSLEASVLPENQEIPAVPLI